MFGTKEDCSLLEDKLGLHCSRCNCSVYPLSEIARLTDSGAREADLTAKSVMEPPDSGIEEASILSEVVMELLNEATK